MRRLLASAMLLLPLLSGNTPPHSRTQGPTEVGEALSAAAGAARTRHLITILSNGLDLGLVSRRDLCHRQGTGVPQGVHLQQVPVPFLIEQPPRLNINLKLNRIGARVLVLLLPPPPPPLAVASSHLRRCGDLLQGEVRLEVEVVRTSTLTPATTATKKGIGRRCSSKLRLGGRGRRFLLRGLFRPLSPLGSVIENQGKPDLIASMSGIPETATICVGRLNPNPNRLLWGQVQVEGTSATETLV